jgi:hypothetical protein
MSTYIRSYPLLAPGRARHCLDGVTGFMALTFSINYYVIPAPLFLCPRQFFPCGDSSLRMTTMERVQLARLAKYRQHVTTNKRI